MATYNADGSALPPSKKKIALQIFTNRALARGDAGPSKCIVSIDLAVNFVLINIESSMI